MEQVPLAIKKERIKKLIDLQFKIGNEEALACVGKTYEVLCAEHKNGKVMGKSSCEKAITFAGSPELVGKFVQVKIIGTKNNQLKGEIVE